MTEIDGPTTSSERAAAVVAGDGAGAVELAVIWATVDLDRTLAGLGVEPKAVEASLDALLGARVVVIPSGEDRSRLAIAEPITEGRLAATLARHGEGPAGRYLAVPDGLAQARNRAADAGIAVSRMEDGPFGRSMLVLIDPASGPHLILCEPAAVPSNP